VYYQTFTAVVVKLSECVGNATGIIMPANLGTDLAKKTANDCYYYIANVAKLGQGILSY